MNHSTTMRGGAVVLIVLLMLSLSMFGVLSMVSANSDLKAARKNAEWIKTYYALDTQGQHRLREAETALRDAGFASLADAGWTLEDGGASLNLTEGVQNLHITVALREDRLVVLGWRQWQEPFDYDLEEGDLWLS